jgi:Rrf2 family nitric oxide-sensitive transcriptional repressor
MISLSAQYALRAIVHIAGNDGMHTADTIAQKTGIPRGYLAKILQRLHQCQLVDTQRGKGGGYALANAPTQITVLQVVRAIVPREELSVCHSCESDNCRVAGYMRSITDLIDAALLRTTLDEFLQSCASSRTLPLT